MCECVYVWMEPRETNFLLNVAQLWRQTNQIKRVPRRNNEQNAQSITMSGVDQSNETARQLNVNARAIIYSFTLSVLPEGPSYTTVSSPFDLKCNREPCSTGVSRAELDAYTYSYGITIGNSRCQLRWHQNLFGMSKELWLEFARS